MIFASRLPQDGLGRMAERTVSIRMALNLLACVCGILCFFMTRDGIGWGPALLFLLALLGAFLMEILDLPRPPGLLSFGVAAGLLVPILSQVSRRYVAEPFLEAILLLFALRLFERKTSREYVQLALIALAAVVVYALLSVEKFFFAACLGTGYCASLILMLSAWLRREPGARVSLIEAKGLLFRALGMFALMVPLCLLIFFFGPRIPRPVLRPQTGADRAVRTGFSERLRLGEVEGIQGSDRLAFRAQTRELPPDSLYWRGVVLSYFTGTGWEVDLRARGEGWGRPDGNVPRVRQTIILEPGGHRWLFALDRPLSVRGVAASNLGNGTFWRQTAEDTVRYEGVSVLTPLPGVLSPLAEAVFLELPPGYSPALRRLTEEITAGIPEARGRMDAIEAYFKRGDYLWSLGKLVRGEDALERFVLDVKRGNCEYFASAAGVMLRMANVPARLVGGYRGGFYNRAGGFYSVRDRQAHVWVEAWDRDAGCWVRLDPTPAGATEEEVVSGGLGVWWEFWDFLDYQWNERFVRYNAGTQREWVGVLREILSNPRASLQAPSESLLRWGKPGAWLAALLAAAAALRLFRKRRRRDPGRALLDRFERIMKKRGFSRRRAEGLEEFIARLGEPLRRTTNPFVLEFEAVWYGGRPLDRERYGRLKAQLDEIERMR